MLIFQTVTGRLVTPETDVLAGTSAFRRAKTSTLPKRRLEDPRPLRRYFGRSRVHITNVDCRFPGNNKLRMIHWTFCANYQQPRVASPTRLYVPGIGENKNVVICTTTGSSFRKKIYERPSRSHSSRVKVHHGSCPSAVRRWIASFVLYIGHAPGQIRREAKDCGTR